MSERGTTNGNARGSSYERRRRRAWLMENWASDLPGFVRCYRCGRLLFNDDDAPECVGRLRDMSTGVNSFEYNLIMRGWYRLTIDRIIPGCQGGTYRRNNIRPACGACNSETGGGTRRKGTP